MKKLALFVFISIWINSLSAQKVSFGLEYNPYKTISYSKLLGTASHKQLNHKLGVSVYLNDNERFQFITGSHVVFKKSSMDLLFPTDIENGTYNITKFETKNIYLIIPLQGKVSLSEKIPHFYSRFGLDFWFNIYAKGRLDSKEWTDRNSDAVTNFHFVPNLAIGYDFQITPSVKMFLEPKIEFSFPDIHKKLRLPENYVYYGINMGIIFGKKAKTE